MAVLENLLEPNLIRWQFDQLIKERLSLMNRRVA
jgi:hypothetical protein